MTLTKSVYQIKTYAEFKEAYVEPTKLAWLKWLFIDNFKDIKYHAKTMSSVFSKGPFNEEEFQQTKKAFMSSDGTDPDGFAEKTATEHHKLHSRTYTGWLLNGLIHYVAFFATSYKAYCDQENANDYDWWLSAQEDLVTYEVDRSDDELYDWNGYDADYDYS